MHDNQKRFMVSFSSWYSIFKMQPQLFGFLNHIISEKQILPTDVEMAVPKMNRTETAVLYVND